MRILYLGDLAENSGSASRALALRTLGHEVESVDPEQPLVGGRWQSAFHYRTGYRWLRRKTEVWLRSEIGERTFDVVWVNGGPTIDRRTLGWLRGRARYLVNYNNDDPTGRRDWCRWGTFREAVPGYDVLLTMRSVAVDELRALGAQRVKQVFMSYDESVVCPQEMTAAEIERWKEKVLFVGTWMPERGPFLAALIRQGVPVAIYGNRWLEAPEREVLRAVVRGPAISGKDYVKAMQSADVCLGLLSKGNRDLHTIRSSEIPAVGSLLCAERTVEHTAMYRENREAVFWADAAECAARCREMLAEPVKRRAIAEAGRRRVLELRLTHTCVLQDVLAELDGGAR
jgi:spore maturation protein CgeB